MEIGVELIVIAGIIILAIIEYVVSKTSYRLVYGALVENHLEIENSLENDKLIVSEYNDDMLFDQSDDLNCFLYYIDDYHPMRSGFYAVMNDRFDPRKNKRIDPNSQLHEDISKYHSNCLENQ